MCLVLKLRTLKNAIKGRKFLKTKHQSTDKSSNQQQLTTATQWQTTGGERVSEGRGHQQQGRHKQQGRHQQQETTGMTPGEDAEFLFFPTSSKQEQRHHHSSKQGHKHQVEVEAENVSSQDHCPTTQMPFNAGLGRLCWRAA